MSRKIIFLLLSVFIGFVVTAYSSQVKIEGIRWLVPGRGGCGNHWGGLPFSYRHMYLYDNDAPPSTIIQCVGVGRPLPLFIDWFIWSFIPFAIFEAADKTLRSKRKAKS